MATPLSVAEGTSQATNAFAFAFTSIDGEPLPLSRFQGKTLLIVNTASFCSFTRQYAALRELQTRYGDGGLVVLGVPSNDFGRQEPGGEAEIKTFCEATFDINFPLTTKEHVKGSRAHPFYEWAAKRFGFAARPRWNFHKYLVAPDGRLVDWFSTLTSPTSGRVVRAVEAHLPATAGGGPQDAG